MRRIGLGKPGAIPPSACFEPRKSVRIAVLCSPGYTTATPGWKTALGKPAAPAVRPSLNRPALGQLKFVAQVDERGLEGSFVLPAGDDPATCRLRGGCSAS